jgi:hypothetical protein
MFVAKDLLVVDRLLGAIASLRNCLAQVDSKLVTAGRGMKAKKRDMRAY